MLFSISLLLRILLFFGRCARLFFMITSIASFVFWVACAALFKITIITKFCFPGGVHNYFLNYYHHCECCLCGVVCAVIFNYYHHGELCSFGWCARLFF